MLVIYAIYALTELAPELLSDISCSNSCGLSGKDDRQRLDIKIIEIIDLKALDESIIFSIIFLLIMIRFF